MVHINWHLEKNLTWQLSKQSGEFRKTKTRFRYTECIHVKKNLRCVASKSHTNRMNFSQIHFQQLSQSFTCISTNFRETLFTTLYLILFIIFDFKVICYFIRLHLYVKFVRTRKPLNYYVKKEVNQSIIYIQCLILL